MKTKLLICAAFCFIGLTLLAVPVKIVILGASNATPGADRWATLYADYLTSLDPANSVVNLAVNGYATYNIVPATGDGVHDIVGAVSQNPSAIIVSITGNDYGASVPSATIRSNFTAVYNYAHAAGVPVWISTPFPDIEGASRLVDIQQDAAWMTNAFPDHCFDIWPSFAQAGTNCINNAYMQDSAHINAAGHYLYFQILTNAGIYQSLTPPLASVPPKEFLPLLR